MDPDQPIVILGCTAAGKSDLAEALALRLGGDHAPATILAVDSMQVYRGMDIGTAKPDAATRARFAYRMLDVADPWEIYSAARFVVEARSHLQLLSEQQKPVIIVAGTMLYLRALIEGLFEGPSADEALRQKLHARATAEGSQPLHAELAKIDPAAAERIHPNDLRRIIRALEVFTLTGTPISTLQTQWAGEHPAIPATYIGIHREKDALNRRINARVKKMIENSLVEEVRRLAADRRGFSDEAQSAVGYRQLLDHFAGKCSLEDAIEQIKIQTRSLAKMQRTWLKRWPGPCVHWLTATDATETPSLVEQALSCLQAAQQHP